MKTLLLLILTCGFALAQNDKEYIDNQNKWLKEYTDVQLDALRRAVDKSEVAQKNAIDKVEANNNDYRMQQNEWRGQIKDREGTFATKSDVEALNKFMYMMVGALMVIQFIGIGGILLFIKTRSTRKKPTTT